MVIQHNLPAMNSHRQMGINNNQTSKNLEKLSSGFKINRAGDDAAGLAISEKMRGQIRGLNMATQNANNGISLIQTAEGGLNETHDILQRMRELAVQSANGTYDDATDRLNLTKEVDALKSEIDRISTATNYNGIELLDGSLNPDANMAAKTTDKTAGSYGIDTLATATGANTITAGTATVTFSLDTDGKLKAGANTVLSASVTGGANDTATVTANGGTFTFKFDEAKIIEDLKSAGTGATVDVNFETTAYQAAVTTAVPGTVDAIPATGMATVSGITNATDIGTVEGKFEAALGGVSPAVSDLNGKLLDGTLDIQFDYSGAEVAITAEGWTVSGDTTFAGDKKITFTKDGASITVDMTGLDKTSMGSLATDSLNDVKVAVSIGVNAGTPTSDAVNASVKLASGRTPATPPTGTPTAAQTPPAVLKTPAQPGKELTFQIGANGSADQVVGLKVADMSSTGLGINGISVGDQASANLAIDVLDKAINTVSGTRADLGALQNRLEHTVNNLGTTRENLQAAESSIRDVDMAKEMMEFTKNNILVQASQSMLAQSNQLPQGVLQLLR